MFKKRQAHKNKLHSDRTTMSLKANVDEALKQYFGFNVFKENQREIIQSLLDGKDVFVLMPTGGGKSLCYQLPALMMEGVAIVVSPLIALMKNQVDAMRSTNEEDRIAHFLNSSLTKSAIEEVKADILSGTTKMLYLAPESLAKLENLEFLKKVKISFYAVDEAHCISEWGHDFRQEYRNLRNIINEIGRAPIIALTATATDKVRLDIKKNLGIPDALDFKSSFNRANLYYEVRPKTSNIDRDIIKYIKKYPQKSGIIYCLSRKKVEELSEILQMNGIKSAPYHAGLDSSVRSATQDDFLMERVHVIVATIAFGMGIDKPDVRFVIHYDMPKSIEGYYQETGRAGRDGGEGRCIAFYAKKDLLKLEKFMEGKLVAEKEQGQHLLREMAAYAESPICRRKLLLHYFGEKYEVENCCNCDNCLNTKKYVEAKEHLCDLIEVLIETKERFSDEYVINFLIGKKTEENAAHKHQDAELFGCGDDLEEHEWEAVIRQGVMAGYLERNGNDTDALSVSAKGKKFLKNPTSFEIVDSQNPEDDIDTADGATQDSALDPALHKLLIDIRKKLAKAQNIQPYLIFRDNSLEAMSTVYPLTMEELANIPGVGMQKAKKYGEKFLEALQKYCKENDIERPDELRIRTIANKSKMKVEIIQSIDRKVPLDALAESKGIAFSELLDEIEAIVYSGTKINIDYFINEVLEEEHVEDIYDYFHEAETDDLEAAYDELDADYSPEEIRLIRIKFLSEMAN